MEMPLFSQIDPIPTENVIRQIVNNIETIRETNPKSIER